MVSCPFNGREGGKCFVMAQGRTRVTLLVLGRRPSLGWRAWRYYSSLIMIVDDIGGLLGPSVQNKMQPPPQIYTQHNWKFMLYLAYMPGLSHRWAQSMWDPPVCEWPDIYIGTPYTSSQHVSCLKTFTVYGTGLHLVTTGHRNRTNINPYSQFNGSCWDHKKYLNTCFLNDYVRDPYCSPTMSLLIDLIRP